MDLILLARLLLAAVFAVAGIAKLRDLPGSRRAVAEFGVTPRLAAPLGTLLPLIELIVGGALIAEPTAAWGALAALSLLLVFAAAIAWNLGRGKAPDCHCFGQLHSSPAGLSTVARNLGLATFAAAVAAELAGPVPTGAIVVVGATGLVSVAAAAWWRPEPPATAGEHGPALGTPAPSFRLPSLHGPSMTLESLQAAGHPVLLVFSDPGCGPCAELAPQVARWQHEHSGELTIAVLERARNGSGAATVDEHGRVNVLLQRDGEVADAYRAPGTPSAVLVGLDGVIASPLAGGAVEIQMLVAANVSGMHSRSAAPNELAESRRRRASGRPLIRRELLERGAMAWAVTGSLLAWPSGALGRVRSRRPCSGENHRCGDFCCGPDQDCLNNRCRCTQRRFPDKCGKECVDTRTDPDHCGGCGPRGVQGLQGPPPMEPPMDPPMDPPASSTVCAPGFACVGGRCRPGDGSECGAEPGTICCGGEEVGPNFDDANCGGCGVRCNSGRDPRCCSGVCTDGSTDPRNCGACGKRCHEDEVCSNGQCRRRCRRGQKVCHFRGGGRGCYDPASEGCCGGQVIGTQSDNKNCGKCGNVCSTSLSPVCCNGKCVTLGLDNCNCGECGKVCPPGEFCRFGTCVCGGSEPCTGPPRDCGG